jgi:putative ABC transport system permease protein
VTRAARTFVETLGSDARLALRSLRKSPGFTAIVVGTIALGIGANAAIFGLIDQVLLRPLPVADPGRLVVLDAPGPFSGHSSTTSPTLTPVSHPMFEGLRDRTTGLAGAFAHRETDIHLAVGDQAENATADLVSGAFFQVLGVQPALGRLLSPDDDRAGAPPVVVLADRVFRARFGGDPQVIGRTVHVNSHPMTVVGVAPPGFHGVEVGAAVDVFVPLARQPEVLPTGTTILGSWRTRWLTVMARLAPGVSRAEAQTAANVVYAQLLQEDAATVVSSQTERSRREFLAKRLALLPGARGTSGLREETRTPLLALMGMVALVLLIACANVANLLLARGSGRQKELAVRLALGAGRARLLRQMLVESLLLSAFGGALGLVLAAWTGRALIAALPFGEAARTLSAEPDLRVALFALALSVLTGLVFGLLPALQATRLPVGPALKSEARGASGAPAQFRFRRALVVAQIALSLLLLVGAGLFTRSLANLRTQDPGFRTERLVTFRVDPSLSGYEPARRLAVLDRLREALLAEPGVRAASLADTPLLANSDNSSTVLVEGYTAREDEDMNPNFNRVGPDFFATMGMPLLRGRDLTDADRLGATKVAVVNETFARYFFGNADPLGRRFGRARDKVADVEIVGVVKDSQSMSLRETPPRFVYVAAAQQAGLGEMTFYVRTAGDPAQLAARVPGLVRGVDPALPVTNLRTMQAQIRESLAVDRMAAALSAAFGLLATVLAALGLYGVMAYAVSLRTREIGIRMALGALRGDVVRMVLRDVGVLVAAGIALGLPAGYGLGRLIESQLFRMTARDPLAFGIATAALVLAALAAGYLPARRATRVDPLTALRAE